MDFVFERIKFVAINLMMTYVPGRASDYQSILDKKAPTFFLILFVVDIHVYCLPLRVQNADFLDGTCFMFPIVVFHLS